MDDPSSDAFKLSVDNTVRLYHNTYGVPYNQLMVGATFYGRGWKNVSSTNNGLYQRGQEALGINENGYNYYRDLILLEDSGYSMHWDDLALAAWLYSPVDNIFWSMDDPQSIALKRRYIDAYGLGGGMFWEISGDDDDASLLNALVTGNPGDRTASTMEDTSLDISITKPLNCSISLEGFNVVVNAESSVANIAQVEFFLGGSSLGFDNRPPWSWAGFNLSASVQNLTAVLTDTSGNYNTSAPVTLNVYDNDALALWQTGISYQVGDQVFYEGCIYQAKRNHVGSRVRLPTSYRYWDLVTCTDCGGSGGDGNTAPSVIIDSPEADAPFNEGDDVTINATASDPDIGDMVTKVVFYQNGSELGEDTTASYSWVWNSVPVGSHSITVIAHDQNGGTDSASIMITVSSTGGCTTNAWNSMNTYNKGDRVEHTGILWQCKRTNQGIEPGTSPSKWTNLGPCNS